MINSAFILCGGKGTRLGQITQNTPKPLVKVNNKEVIHYIINELIVLGIKNIILITGHLHEQFDDFIKYQNERFIGANIKIKKLIEDKPLGTAGLIIKKINQINENILVVNGDSFFRSDLFLKHKIKNFSTKDNSLVRSIYISNSNRYGLLDINKENNSISNINEKQNANKSGYINSGLYIFNIKELLLYKKSNINKEIISFEYDVFPFLIKKKLLKTFHSLNNIFLDIGIPEDFKKAPSFLKENLSRGIIFTDRDDTLNYDKGYTHLVKDLRLIKKNINLITSLNEGLNPILVISNQSGIARGLYTNNDLNNFNQNLSMELAKFDLNILGYYCCMHHPDITGECNCRKPKTGLFDQAANEWNIDKEKSIMIGNSLSDIVAGENFGVNCIYVPN